MAAGAIMSREPMMITGRTIRIGGPPILCAEGIKRDRAWFERHHGRNHYFRSPIGGETASLEGGPPGWLPIIVVRQVEPGARIRAACWVQGVH
jgi:hypothetical protein